jgi:SAM-dependent methyltransferase
VCNRTGIAFGERVLSRALVEGRDVLEVGALDVNGSLRPHVESLMPRRYVGVDIAPGPRVDVVVDAQDLVDHFGLESFDIVVTTEMLEHVRNWRLIVRNLKQVLRADGLLLLTTRSLGFPYHGYPHDFWRYERDDIKAIFADFEIVDLEPDLEAPGIFMLARKPPTYTEARSAVRLYSMVAGRRRNDVRDAEIVLFRARRLATQVSARSRARWRGVRRTLRSRLVSPVWRRLPPPARRGVKRALRRS